MYEQKNKLTQPAPVLDEISIRLSDAEFHSFFMGVLSPVAILASLRWSSNSKQLKSKHFSSVVQGGSLIRSNSPGRIIQE